MYFALYFVYTALTWAIYVYMIMMAVYILMSWFPGAWQSGFGRFLGRFVDPFLAIFRRFIPPLFGLDFSPVIAFFVLSLLDRMIDYLYYGLLPTVF